MSSADIRIGDLWGNTYKDNKDGVSCAVAFTAKGYETLKASNCELVKHAFDVVAEGQMKFMPKDYRSYHIFRFFLRMSSLNISKIVLIFKALTKIHNRIKSF